MKIDLGCGILKREGYIRIDKDPAVCPDYCLDLEKDKLPFEDNSVVEVLMSHVFEHLRDITFPLTEIYRVLKPEGLLRIESPYWKHESAFSDPDHIRFVTEKTHIYFSRNTIGSDGRKRDYLPYDFKCVDLKYNITDEGVPYTIKLTFMAKK